MLINWKRESTTVAAYLAMLAAALAALGMTAADAWGAPARPDLVVGEVDAAPIAVVQGGSLVVRSSVTNVGGARAGRSTTRLYLSADRFRGTGDVVLAERATRGLGPGRSTALTSAVVLRNAGPGSYYIVACADARGVIAERRDRNNCRATAMPIAVLVPDPEAPAEEAGSEPGHDHGDHDHGEEPEASAG
jgi:hypothetical protein